MALRAWLDALGYQTATLDSSPWMVSANANALFMFNAHPHNLSDQEAIQVLDWVKRGGTLITISEHTGTTQSRNKLWDLLGAEIAMGPGSEQHSPIEASPSQPILTQPVITRVEVQTTNSIILKHQPGANEEAAAYVTLLESKYGSVLVGRQWGKGYVVLGVDVSPFTNRNLLASGGGAVVLNLLARVPQHGTLVFDEFDGSKGTGPSIMGIVRQNWWGWTSIYCLLIIFAYIVFSGKRFGKSLAGSVTATKRTEEEYVLSMAKLFRRGQKRTETAWYYHQALKRQIARRNRLIVHENDAEFIALVRQCEAINKEECERLAQLLMKLQPTRISERELLRLTREAIDFIDPGKAA
ncbi:MAG: hypothetical protein NVS4B8_03510 [Herpetosiphon sp.]